MGPQTVIGDTVHATKYRHEGETFEEAVVRIATALADDAAHRDALVEILGDMRFLPAGRVQAAMGSPRHVTAYNCFVSGTIEDSFVDGPGSIMDRAAEAAATMRMGGGIGYDFSTLRPNGAAIGRLQSHSSGPVSFMEIFNAICRCVSSSGHRRGAQMGVMRVDHPDIEEFVEAKQNGDRLTGFNVSVAVTDRFMHAVRDGRPFELVFGGHVHRTVDARDLCERIMSSTWDWAEPGVLFVDTINRMNNLWYAETISATNPCGEQPLPPFGACLLGSFNWTRYVAEEADQWGTRRWFDFARLAEDVPHVVRAMDNVIDRTNYPLDAQRREAQVKRRMGLGATGVANALEAIGHRYGEPEFLEAMGAILEGFRDACYAASVALAAEKGAFPAFDGRYLDGECVGTLPPDLQRDIALFGIRNSHLTSIAPTGTTSLSADNVSSGIEPVFSYSITRPVHTPTGQDVLTVEDYGLAWWGVRGKPAAEVTATEHIEVLAVAQRFVDSAVSKTCNVSGDMPWADFKSLYETAWERGAKGCTTFNADGKRMALLTATVDEEPVEAACEIDPESGRRSCE